MIALAFLVLVALVLRSSIREGERDGPVCTDPGGLRDCVCAARVTLADAR